MDDKLSLLKIKLHLFYSTDANQRQDQRQLPVKDKKGGSSTGPPIYVSGLTIRINPYIRKINPAEFFNRFD